MVKPVAKPVVKSLVDSKTQVEIMKTKSGRGLWVMGDTRIQKDKLIDLAVKVNSGEVVLKKKNKSSSKSKDSR